MRTSNVGAMCPSKHGKPSLENVPGYSVSAWRSSERTWAYSSPPILAGNAETARELVSRLGIEGARAREAETLIMDFILSRVPQFTRRWMDRVDRFLDPYSTDQWWTEDMRAAFALYCQHKDEPEEMPE